MFPFIPLQDSLWADSEFFYSFWRESPVAGLVHQLYPEADGVRLLVDLFVGFKREARPVVLVSRSTFNTTSTLPNLTGGLLPLFHAT